jgi:hypothetical protein
MFSCSSRFKRPCRTPRALLSGVFVVFSFNQIVTAQTIQNPVYPIAVPEVTQPSPEEIPSPSYANQVSNPSVAAPNDFQGVAVLPRALDYYPSQANPICQPKRPAQCDQLMPAREPNFAPVPDAAPGVGQSVSKRNIHHVYIQPPCNPASATPSNSFPDQPQQQQQQQQLPAGAFVAPPQAGSVVSQQSSIGIRGMRLRIPALTLELPTLEMPSIFRRGRGVHMEVDGATANYVAGAGVNPGMTLPAMASMPMASYSMNGAPQSANPSNAQFTPKTIDPPAPASAPRPMHNGPAASSEQLLNDYDMLQRRCERLENMLMQMQELYSVPRGHAQVPCDVGPTPPLYCPPHSQ